MSARSGDRWVGQLHVFLYGKLWLADAFSLSLSGCSAAAYAPLKSNRHSIAFFTSLSGSLSLVCSPFFLVPFLKKSFFADLSSHCSLATLAIFPVF